MPASTLVYLGLVLLVTAERWDELKRSRRQLDWARSRGGVEFGVRHYPAVLLLHGGLLVGCLVEPWAAQRPFLPALAWPMAALTVAAQALRRWCITALGPRWTARIVVLPGVPLVTSGPYRWFRHPHYLAVLVEGVALPMTHSAWLTASLFSALYLLTLAVRIRTEQEAHAWATA
ncbi:alkylresorcinol O-methyltransferase [Streptoalloteichus tenebrarius]|uniref:Alkylresorcinol O-methyltransferase n=1 Tax=Streptoalloteichus tenebrarius (strain ATCC 17920 / DSM 40477 / JCM 4838 / CBS 697.72 / NBRC 16177 / NCIMB 11028 / NRRL B-12390 / A12253. 1 / ISP 5477) TaxID=1933 RepID=A0ABT1HP91_STRSD|nr:isoprenylcysteine carboxylmethyltransferase family protein [Streptoalloteichus tenebrarius]MCP2257328.1 alkylresorcinol O-methyltransferase [Streptoalloteichus tenebrarius]BFF04237.1 isoprenylcysteine carboxylmethyltransferase family protein [Streptoalloteichus tenebrarius]